MDSNNKTVETEEKQSEIAWKNLFRQIFVCTGIWAGFFSFGLSYGSPTVFIPQIRREANSTEVISIEMVSWLSCTFNYSGLVNGVLLAILAKQIGRKLSFLFVCVTALIGFVLFYFSTTITHILISQAIHGILTACTITISLMTLTEYTSPRYRGIFLTLKSATFLWGIGVSNAIGTFFHWKNIGIVGFICSMYTLITALYWPESPYWLASKGRFDECATSHRWLKGFTEESERELEVLMESRKKFVTTGMRSRNYFRKICIMFNSKAFYKPISLSVLMLLLYNCSGKIACAMYALDIIKRISKTESSAYTGMLILDGITIIGMYIGCGLSKILKRRTLLLVSSAVGIIFLLLLSLYLYLISLGIIIENAIMSISLLMCYSLAISVGPMIMSTSIMGELIPVKYRSSSLWILGCVGNFLMGSVLKISPFILNSYGNIGLFLFFASFESVWTILAYFVLPETKDKTILEIQECLLGTK